ncbi:MAG: hypothetical protein FJ104_11510, partial [Deltaproteobacteria bacterium]|nr:hypothetical protein [Deltaproteobacteria bacterium]
APLPAQAPARSGTPSLTLIAVIALAVLAVLGVALWPRQGSLVITVSGPGNKPIDAVEVLVNGEKKCSSSPCTIDGLGADTYYVRAHAAGYQAMADIAVVVAASQKTVHNLTLVRALGTGVKVIGEGTGLRLLVDGREVGPLPQEIKDMEAGEHILRVVGSDRLEPFEKRVTVEAEQMQTIGPVKLRVMKGLATIQAGPNADDAKVILISGADRRTLPRLPITLDIPTSQQHTLVATKRGFEQFKLPIKFEDGEVEKTFEVALLALGTGGDDPSGGRQAGGGTDVVPPRPPVGGGGGGGAVAGMATLNINSIPVSSVILDGRPIGPTPKVGLRVSGGAHTVVFVRGSDRKVQSVNVTAGQTKTVAVRF